MSAPAPRFSSPSVNGAAREPTTRDAIEALRGGPRGAMLIAAIAVGLLFVGWLLFYFVLFMRRGSVG